MRLSVWTLVLLALTVSSADSELFYDYDGAQMKYYELTLDIATSNDYIMSDGKMILVEYGADIILTCSAPRHDEANITIKRDGVYMETNQLDAVTVQLVLTNENLGIHEYECQIKDTTYAVTDRVLVRPAISVVSPRVHHTLNSGNLRYFVPVGEIYDVLCVGKGNESLHIYDSMKGRPVLLEADGVNTTTIKHTHVTKEEHRRIMSYKCMSQSYKSQSLTLIIDYYPEAQNFQCILHERYSDLECSWSYFVGNSLTYKLFQDVGESILLCFDNMGFKTNTRSCVASINHFTTPDLHLVLQTCNEVFCANQTFSVNRMSSLKFDPPSELKLADITSHGAVLSWRSPSDGYFDLVFKVEYRLLGAPWQRAYTSSVQCYYDGHIYCKLQLYLPCSDAHHGLRVYAKHKEVVEAKFWSEPSLPKYFFTAPSNADDAVNSECNTNTQKRAPPPSADMMVYNVEQLITYERKQESVLKGEIRGLRHKVREAKALMDLLDSSAKSDF